MRDKITTQECLAELQARQHKMFCLFCGTPANQNSAKNKKILMKITGSSLSYSAKRLLVLMNKIAYIQKTKFNSFRECPYETEAEILAACAAQFLDHDILIFYSPLERYCEAYQTPDNKKAFRVIEKLQVTFVDKDDGDRFTEIFMVDGSEPYDKGIYKAITGAQKDALMRTLMIASNDNPSFTIEQISNSVTNQLALIEWLEASAKQGKKIFRQHWTSLSSKQREIAQKHLELFLQLATKAEQLKAGDPLSDANDRETSGWDPEWF